MSISHTKQPPPTWWSNRWRPRWTHDHWKTSAKSSQWCLYSILKMAMVKSLHVTLKAAHNWGPHVSGTQDISKQTGNSLSSWSTRNSRSSWSYGLTYAFSCVVHRLPHEPLSSLDQQRRGLSTIVTSHQRIVCTMSPHISQTRWLTVSMLFYPWSWRPQDIHPVSESDICDDTMANHRLFPYHRSDNNRQEQISTRSINDKQ